jgi:hypothetical protein
MVEKEAPSRNMEPRTGEADVKLLMATDIELPWYKSVFKGIAETINPPKLPPLELTSRPVESDQLGDLEKLEQPWCLCGWAGALVCRIHFDSGGHYRPNFSHFPSSCRAEES